MQGDVVTKIAELAQVQEFVINDANDKAHSYTSKPVHEVKPAALPQPAAVGLVSLLGFSDLVKAKLENLDPTNWIIHVRDHCTVALISRIADEHGRRLELVKATPVPTEQFKFGQFMENEAFIIAVASKFVLTDDLTYVINIASGLTSGATRTAEDNGLLQKVTIKRGMSLPSDAVIKNRVSLAPYRTFPEVRQPISDFLFRLKDGGEDEKPSLALFEADGGKWKLDAINEVRRVLETYTLGIPVVA